MSQETLSNQSTHPLTYRPATASDQVALHTVFADSVWDLAWRIGIQDGARKPTPEECDEDLRLWKPILDHLAATADQFWVAERDGQPIGYARSILREGVRELTEFFVAPDAQTAGVGRELLARAMPSGAKRTYIIATLDLRAQALYHKLGVYQICAVCTFYRKGEIVPSSAPSNDLTIIPITPDQLPMLAKIDQATHGFTREPEHEWLMATRTGFLFLRNEQVVGYGYVGDTYSGPFALLNSADYPAALAHAESVAAAHGFIDLAFDTPMLNRNAIAYLLGRGYHMSPFFCFYMCNQHPLHVDKTIITAPMILI